MKIFLSYMAIDKSGFRGHVIMGTVIIRNAKMDECRELARIKGEVWNTTYRGIYADTALDNYDVEKNNRIFQQIFNNPGIELFLAEVSGKIVGLMTCGNMFQPVEGFNQEIGLLYVLKEYQRMGIGRRFLETAKEIVKRNGCDRFLVSVNSQNKNAIAFYEKMGGREIAGQNCQKRFCFIVSEE